MCCGIILYLAGNGEAEQCVRATGFAVHGGGRHATILRTEDGEAQRVGSVVDRDLRIRMSIHRMKMPKHWQFCNSLQKKTPRRPSREKYLLQVLDVHALLGVLANVQILRVGLQQVVRALVVDLEVGGLEGVGHRRALCDTSQYS